MGRQLYSVVAQATPMIPFLLWLVAVELLGLAALPLAMAALPRLADHGYGLAKVLGVLLITYCNFLFGSLFGRGNNPVLLIIGMVMVCALGLFAIGRVRRDEGFTGGRGLRAWFLGPRAIMLRAWFRENRALVLIEEILFLALFVIWTLFRAAHPAVLSTEKPMDLALMTAAHRATSFPAYDPWMAGATINYYYGGYLAIGTLVTLSGVAPTVGYNLGLALLFALVGSAAYSISYGLTRNMRWAVLGPIFVLLIGNLDGLAQLLNGHGGADFDFWHSSRIVDGGQTINEFPAFSFLLGDMHPHVIALPFTLLAIGMALNMALAPAAGWTALAPDTLRRGLTAGLAALAAGALYFMNSWDWPTYLLLMGVALLLPGLVSLARRPLGEGLGLAIGILALSYLLYVTFRQEFKPQYNHFGIRVHGSPVGQVLTVFGLFLIPIAAFIAGYLPGARGVARPDRAPAPRRVAAGRTAPAPAARSGAAARSSRGGRGAAATVEREPEDGEDEDNDDELPLLPMPSLPSLTSPLAAGVALVSVALAMSLLFGLAGGLGTAGLLLPFLCAALFLAWREGRQGRQHNAFALLLCAGGMGLIILCDGFYLKDLFCGATDAAGTCQGDLYRMNTVFKFYYQAWTVLALGAAYGLYALSTRLHAGWRRFVAPVAAGAVTVLGGIYLILGIATPTTNTYTVPVANAAPTLDGGAYLDSYSGQPISITNAIPADAAAIRWLRDNVPGHPTILEADQDPNTPTVGQDYWPFPGYPDQELMMSRISTFTGLPAVLGSGGSHEGLWHGQGLVDTRFAAVRSIYTNPAASTVGALLRTYNVAYIYLGQVESYTYYNNNPERRAAALARFTRFGRVVYNNGGVTIVRTSFGAS